MDPPSPQPGVASFHTQQHPTNHVQTQDQALRHPHLHRHQHPNQTPQHPHQRPQHPAQHLRHPHRQQTHTRCHPALTNDRTRAPHRPAPRTTATSIHTIGNTNTTNNQASTTPSPTPSAPAPSPTKPTHTNTGYSTYINQANGIKHIIASISVATVNLGHQRKPKPPQPVNQQTTTPRPGEARAHAQNHQQQHPRHQSNHRAPSTTQSPAAPTPPAPPTPPSFTTPPGASPAPALTNSITSNPHHLLTPSQTEPQKPASAHPRTQATDHPHTDPQQHQKHQRRRKP